MKKNTLFPLAAILIASPLLPAQQSASNIKLSTSALSFNGSSGNVSSQPLTITVTGSRPVTIRSVSFSNSTFFGPPVSLPVTLSAGQSLTGQVSAHPKSTSQAGTLTIGSDAGTLTVSLSETATATTPTAHSVSLSWQAPNSSAATVDSYQVERAPSGSTQYSVVGTTTAASTTYSDTSVQAGKTYLYEVRAVDDQGVASPPSNTISLSIP